MFYSDSGLYSPHQRWLPNTLPGLPWGYLPQMPDFSLRCRQSRQISSSFRMSLGAVRSSHSNRDTSRFVLSISFPPVSVSSAGEPPPAHSTAVLRTARLFRKARRSNHCPAPASPHTGISARLTGTAALRKAHLFRKAHCSNHCPCQHSHTWESPPARSTAALCKAHLFRPDRLFPHQTAAAVENHTPVSSIQWIGWLSQ